MAGQAAAGAVTGTIWYDPGCSKCRQTLALLEAAGADVAIVRYLDIAPARSEIARIVAAAGLHPRDALRADAQARFADADEAAIIAAMAAAPALIQRPFVETPRGVRLCRPPERVREIL